MKTKYLILVNISSLVKKTDYNIKFTEIEKKLTDRNHDKYIPTPEFNTLAADVFNARLAQANLITKTDFDSKMLSLNRKITTNKTKHLLVENELKQLKTFDSSYFRGKSHFEENGTQNYLVFQPINRYFKVIANTKYISTWKSKRLSDESIKPPATSDNSLSLLINYLDNKRKLKFNEGCLILQNKPTYTHSTFVNLYIVYELSGSDSSSDDPILRNSLFGAVKFTKNGDIDKYWYSGYWVGFDRKGSFSFRRGGFGQNIIIFEVDMSSSVHVDNQKKDILIIWKGPTQGLGKHSLTAKKCIQLILQLREKKMFKLAL